MRKWIRCLLAVLSVLLLVCTASAEVVQPTYDFWYYDEANVLSEATKGEIFFANQRLQDACGAEIAVVVVDSTGNMAIDDYAYTLFNEWEIGGESYRGMLILLAIDDDNYYTMPGTSMAGYFVSATLSDMQIEYLEPNFAAKNYDQGVKRYFEAMFEKIADDLNLDLSIDMAISDYNAFALESGAREIQTDKQPTTYRQESRSGSGFPFGKVVIVVLLVILLVYMMKKRPRNAGHSAVHSAPPPRVHVAPPPKPRASSPMSFPAGFMLGRMLGNRSAPRQPMGGPAPRPPVNPGPARRPGGFGQSPFGGPAGGNRPNSGPSRSSFGSSGIGRTASRPSGGFSSRSSGIGRSSGSRSSGGFGGASRSGGASRGPSTRGGGAGRMSRK